MKCRKLITLEEKQCFGKLKLSWKSGKYRPEIQLIAIWFFKIMSSISVILAQTIEKIVRWKITRFCTVWLYLLQNSKLNRLPLSPVFPVAHCKVVLPTVMGLLNSPLCPYHFVCACLCFACSVSVSYSTNIEMNILSFQRNLRYWLHRRLSFRKLSVQLVMKITSMCVVALNGQ